MSASSLDRRDLYAEVTDRIVAALESGTVPWRRPWIASSESHRNPCSGTIYRGINPFLLELTALERGYSDPRWVTFKQSRDLGGCVRKGERGTLVVFFKQLKVEDREAGESRTIPLLRHFTTFNVAQVDGIDWPALPQPAPFDPIERAEAIIDGMPQRPTIGHGGNRAFYAPVFDAVQLPTREQFLSSEAYYATAFHELAHSTGHASRLDRPEVSGAHHAFGDEAYSREELVAEMAAAMLCGVAAISPPTIDNAAAYIAGWLRALRDDRKLLVSAASRAQRAADFILNTRDSEKEPSHEK